MAKDEWGRQIRKKNAVDIVANAAYGERNCPACEGTGFTHAIKGISKGGNPCNFCHGTGKTAQKEVLPKFCVSCIEKEHCIKRNREECFKENEGSKT
jgi:hypothetical protein